MKRIFITILAIAALCCLFAFTASAAEPDNSKGTVTLNDGTPCALWDTNGVGLIWYIASTTGGVNTYACVSSTDSSVDYNNGWSGGDQLSKITITDANGNEFGASTIVVANLSKGVKITSGYRIGNSISYISKPFSGSTNIQYFYAPLITVSFVTECFKNCSNLAYVNIEELENLTTVGTQTFNGCPKAFAGKALDLTGTKIKTIEVGGFCSIAATEITLPSTLTTVANYAFRSCSSATKITFTGTLTSVNTSELFRYCNKLETIEGIGHWFENNFTSISDYTFENCYVLENIEGLMTDGILIFPEGFTTVNNFTFSNCDQIKFVEFPSTISYLGQGAFAFCDKIVLASFDKVDAKIRAAVANGEQYTKVTFNNCGTFKGCPKLVAMCVPYGTTEIINRFVAQGCSTLTAFYMPDTVTDMGTNSGGQGPFCDAGKMYFVSEPFTVGQCLVDGEVDLTKLVLPEKPSIYFMPESLTTTKGHVQTNASSKDGSFFRNCHALNEVIVFGENYVDYNARNAFQGMGTKESPKTVVFLGNMTQFVIPKNAQYVSFVLANDADKSPEDLGIFGGDYDQNNTNSYMYFCYDESRYDFRIAKANWNSDISVNVAAIMTTKTTQALHVIDTDATIITEAGCETPGSIITYCFCGKDISSTDIAPLGHDFENGAVAYSFGATLYDNVSACTACARNCGTNSEAQGVGAVIKDFGYSIREYKGSTAIARGLVLNKELYSVYQEKYGAVAIGFAVSNVKDFQAGEDGVTLDDFKINFVAKELDGEAYSSLTFKITYKNDTYKDALVYLAAYYANENSVIFADGELEAISYNSVAALETPQIPAE